MVLSVSNWKPYCSIKVGRTVSGNNPEHVPSQRANTRTRALTEGTRGHLQLHRLEKACCPSSSSPQLCAPPRRSQQGWGARDAEQEEERVQVSWLQGRRRKLWRAEAHGVTVPTGPVASCRAQESRPWEPWFSRAGTSGLQPIAGRGLRQQSAWKAALREPPISVPVSASQQTLPEPREVGKDCTPWAGPRSLW